MFHVLIFKIFSAYYYPWLRFFEASIDCLTITHKAFIGKHFPVFESGAGKQGQTPTATHKPPHTQQLFLSWQKKCEV